MDLASRPPGGCSMLDLTRHMPKLSALGRRQKRVFPVSGWMHSHALACYRGRRFTSSASYAARGNAPRSSTAAGSPSPGTAPRRPRNTVHHELFNKFAACSGGSGQTSQRYKSACAQAVKACTGESLTLLASMMRAATHHGRFRLACSEQPDLLPPLRPSGSARPVSRPDQSATGLLAITRAELNNRQ